MTLIDFVFPKLRTPDRWSDKFLKSPVSEDSSTSNMVNELKHCLNLHQWSFILLIDHWKVNWVGKTLCYWHAKSWDCLLKRWLPTKSTSFLLKRDNLTIAIQVQSSQKEETSSLFSGAFLKSTWNFEHFDQKAALTYFVILKLRTLKTSSDKCLKSPAWENPLTSNIVNMPKHFWKLHHGTFIIFIDHCQVNWVGKRFCFWHAKSWDCLLTHWLPMKSIPFLRETI